MMRMFKSHGVTEQDVCHLLTTTSLATLAWEEVYQAEGERHAGVNASSLTWLIELRSTSKARGASKVKQQSSLSPSAFIRIT